MRPPQSAAGQEKIDNAQSKLEGMVDEIGIDNVLALLSLTCAYKAEHLRSNWQDNEGGRQWNRNAKIIDRAVQKIQP